jgi:predicted transcriptional regulator
MTNDEDKMAHMGKVKDYDLERPAPVVNDEDEETLAAIDEGLRDADAGRSTTIDKVRRILPRWITASSSRKER